MDNMWYRLGVLLSLIVISFGTDEMDKSVIIIGSGLSGFSAARKLMESEFNDIIILEAENRIGGRIHSVPFSDGVIDLGAQWVHGQVDNIIYEMTSKYFDFGSTPFTELESTFLFSNGTFPDQKDLRKLYNLGFKVFAELQELEDVEGSIGEVFLEKFDQAIKKKNLDSIDSKIINIMKDVIHININGYCASKSWYDLSAKLNNEEGEAEGDHHNTWKKQGFVTFFDYLTKKAPNPSEYLNIEGKVQLNKKVKNINYAANDAGKVTVTCEDDTKYTAKHVIFTPSLGVLKKYHGSLFTPALPQQKILAIKSYGFGSVGKVFLEFDEKFWLQNGKPFLSYDFLWLDTDREEAKQTNREWLLGIVGIYAVDSFPNLLEVFITDVKLSDFEEASDEKIQEDCMWILEKFLGKSLPKPKAIKKTKWQTNENFLGTYSYGSVDAEKANAGVKDIAETIKNAEGSPVLLFAGEATDINYPSMAHGAVRSGFIVAKEIIDFHE